MAAKRTTVSPSMAMRVLAAHRVPFEALEYDPAIKSGDGVAAALGVPAEQVFKTLVMLADGTRRLLVMTPSNREVNRKALARAVGARDVRMAERVDAERWTGLQTGGIGALALLDKPFEPYIDAAALHFPAILVNGGRRGLNLRLHPRDLIRLTNATVVDTGTDPTV